MKATNVAGTAIYVSPKCALGIYHKSYKTLRFLMAPFTTGSFLNRTTNKQLSVENHAVVSQQVWSADFDALISTVGLHSLVVLKTTGHDRWGMPPWYPRDCCPVPVVSLQSCSLPVVLRALPLNLRPLFEALGRL